MSLFGVVSNYGCDIPFRNVLHSQLLIDSGILIFIDISGS